MAKKILGPDRARAAMLDMIHDHGPDAVFAWIRAARNCADADVDRDGDVYIAEPMRGHWLSGSELVDLVNTINAGV